MAWRRVVCNTCVSEDYLKSQFHAAHCCRKIRKVCYCLCLAAVAAAVYGIYRFFAPDYLEDFEDDFEDDFDDDFFEDEEDDDKAEEPAEDKTEE